MSTKHPAFPCEAKGCPAKRIAGIIAGIIAGSVAVLEPVSALRVS